MADTFIQLPPDSTGKRARSFTATIGGVEVHEQAFVVCDDAANIVGSLAGAPFGTERGLTTRPVQTAREVTGSGAALDALVIPSTDVSGYRWVSVQIAGTFNAGVRFEQSNDNVNWYAVRLGYPSAVDPPFWFAGSPQIVSGPLSARYFRARIESYTSGTVTATAQFFQQNGQTLSSFTYPHARVRATEASLSDFQLTELNMNTKGRLMVSNVAVPQNRDTMSVTTAAEITLATTTGVKEIVTIWHPSTVAKDFHIFEIRAAVRTATTAGSAVSELQFMSAEAATPGGTLLAPQSTYNRTVASEAVVRQVPAAPTVVGNIVQRRQFTQNAVTYEVPIWQASTLDEVIRLRGGQAEGLRITVNVLSALTGAPILHLWARWLEF